MVRNIFRLMSVEPVVFLLAFGFAMYTPIYTQLFRDRVCRQVLHFSASTCADIGKAGVNASADAAVRSEWAQWDAYSTYVGTFPAILYSLFMGPWSDHFGRRVPMLMPSLGAILSAANLLVSAYWLPDSPLWLLLLSPLLFGMFGGFTALLMSVFSYIADISAEDPAARTVRIALVEAAFVIGMSFGFAAGGMMIALGVPMQAVFFVYLVAGVLDAVYVWWRVEETRIMPADATLSQMLRQAVMVRNLADSYETLVKARAERKRQHLWLLLLALLAAMIVMMGENPVMQPYFEFPPLSWSLTDFIAYRFLFAIISSAFLLAGVPALKRGRWHVRDASLGMIGSLGKTAGAFVTSVAAQTWMVYAGGAASSLSAPLIVCIRSLVSKLVEADEQGKMFSLISSAENLAPMLGSLLYTAVFRASGSFWPGACFAMSSLLMLVPLSVFAKVDLDMRAALDDADRRRRSSIDYEDYLN